MGKKTFTQTIDQLRFGTLSDELTDKLNDLNAAVASTGKTGSITVTLKLKPGNGGQVEVYDDIKLKLPEEQKGSSIMFFTPENNLQREDPRQRSLEGLRSVDEERKVPKAVAEDTPRSVKTAG